MTSPQHARLRWTRFQTAAERGFFCLMWGQVGTSVKLLTQNKPASSCFFTRAAIRLLSSRLTRCRHRRLLRSHSARSGSAAHQRISSILLLAPVTFLDMSSGNSAASAASAFMNSFLDVKGFAESSCFTTALALALGIAPLLM